MGCVACHAAIQYIKQSKVNDLNPDITISIVSHGQAQLVEQLLRDIDESEAGNWLKEVIVTCNIPEQQSFQLTSAPLRIIESETPKGFGENHNVAFRHCRSGYFCVVNPDIRLHQNPLPLLRNHLQRQHAGVAGPKVVNPGGKLEDSARPFPSPMTVLRKLVGNRSASLYPDNAMPENPDWVAGMFMMFDAKAFTAVRGFDEGYFLYYEDADICAKLTRAGWPVVYCKEAEVTHDARRDSHRKLRYLRWHLSSMLRFFLLSACRHLRRT